MMIHAQIVPDLDVAESRRCEGRVDASADVLLRKLGSTAVDAQLLNISSHGFMAETDAQIERGARIWLTLPGIPRANALVVWSKGARLGGAFTDPIDPLVVLQAIGTEAAR